MIEAVLDALRQVNDPELDESIVELGFVDHVDVRDDAVEVVLRLPTFMCAPNFAFLMAADARAAALGVPGVRDVKVNLIWDPPWDPSRMSDEARVVLNMW